MSDGGRGQETPGRGWIGRADNRQPLYLHFLRLAHVEKAADALAVDTLLISDKLFRYIVSLTDFYSLASLLQRKAQHFYRWMHWLPKFLLLQFHNKNLCRN